MSPHQPFPVMVYCTNLKVTSQLYCANFLLIVGDNTMFTFSLIALTSELCIHIHPVNSYFRCTIFPNSHLFVIKSAKLLIFTIILLILLYS